MIAVAVGAVRVFGLAGNHHEVEIDRNVETHGPRESLGTETRPALIDPPASASTPSSDDFLSKRIPRALEGTTVDGELVVGLDGHFRPTAAAIRMFRHFMTANGEWSRDQVLSRIESEIDARLVPPASSEARAFLDQYFRYLDASRRLDPAGLDPRDFAERLARARDVQREVFGAALAEELFGAENDLAEAALARLVSRLDAAQAGETRTAREGDRATPSEIDARLPREVREIRERAAAPIESAEHVESLRRSGADPEEVRAERVRRFGADAAARLDELDQRRAEWDARVAAYRVARDAVLAHSGLDAAQRDAAVERVREERFSGDEVRHVAELDRLDLRSWSTHAP